MTQILLGNRLANSIVLFFKGKKHVQFKVHIFKVENEIKTHDFFFYVLKQNKKSSISQFLKWRRHWQKRGIARQREREREIENKQDNSNQRDINSTRFHINYKPCVLFDCPFSFHKCMYQCDGNICTCDSLRTRNISITQPRTYRTSFEATIKFNEKKQERHRARKEESNLKKTKMRWRKQKKKKPAEQEKNRRKDKFYCDSCDSCSTFLDSAHSLTPFCTLSVLLLHLSACTT